MEWDTSDRELWDEWMQEDYPRIEPAIERMVKQDAEQERMRDEIRALEGRVRRLEKAK